VREIALKISPTSSSRAEKFNATLTHVTCSREVFGLSLGISKYHPEVPIILNYMLSDSF
jgi:hypothetical protein